MLPFFLSLSVLCFQPAQANDTTVFSFDTSPKHFLSTGLVTGKTTTNFDQTRFIGLDFNYITANDGRWYGLVSDVIYDTVQNTTTISIAPRIGWYVLGIDGGVSLRLASLGHDVGYHMRGVFTFGYVSCFYRYVFWPAAEKNSMGNHQTGVAFNMPISLSKKTKTSKDGEK